MDHQIYEDLRVEAGDPQVTQIESFCFYCHGKGMTKLLLTKIPHYKDVILSSFECNDCSHRNNSIQLSGVEPMVVIYLLHVKNAKDLSRQVITSDFATVSIPEVDFEIPPKENNGEITTVEGVLLKTIKNLKDGQEARKDLQPDVFTKIKDFITNLEMMLTLETPFTLEVLDPSGNSYIESLDGCTLDPQVQKKARLRTPEENDLLGLNDANEADDSGNANISGQIVTTSEEAVNLKEEVLSFSTLCDQCSRPTQTNMKVTSIPYFKEVVLMATSCESCGYRTNEVKSGGGIAERGKKITLHLVDHGLDMARDILKSDTCNVNIPELELSVGGGILVAKFTTVEGLLKDIQFGLEKNPFLMGDSITEDRKKKMAILLDQLDQVLNGSKVINLILDDPAGNSYVQNVCAPDDDPNLTIEEYERSFEQNEDLGLNDMKTEFYSKDN